MANVTRFTAEVADVLDDPTLQQYTQEEIARHGDRQLRSLHRTMVDGNKEWSNFTIALQKEAALEPLDNVFDYRLPVWVEAVRRVYTRLNDPASQSTFSPYRWTTGGARIGDEIQKSCVPFNQRGGRSGRWWWEGSNTLRLYEFADPQELLVDVVVRPPAMFKGKIATAHADTDKFYLPTPSVGTVDIEEGAYINAEWQITETANANAVHFGMIRRCVYSNASAIFAAARVHEIALDVALPNVIAADDVVETILPFPDQHMRVLVLGTARACMQKKAKLKGLEATIGEYQTELQKFTTYAATPRDTRGPTRWKPRDTRVPPAMRRWGWN